VLNESAAHKFFGNGNVIGDRLKDDKQSYEVVGVVHDLRNGNAISQSVIYLPLTGRDFARPPAGGMTIMVRSDAGTDALTGIRNEIASIDPNLTIFNVQTLTEYLDFSRSDMRFAVRVYGGIGVFGLVLAAIGLAGVTAYAVAQRRKEIGIRTALGASQAQVLRLVLREGTALISVGTVLGFLGAILMARILSAMANILVEALRVGTNDLRLLVGAPLLLAALAMLACYVPARTAAKIDPLQAIREE
jgi:ABC-type antimicrobial peptide transport system permease subunit